MEAVSYFKPPLLVFSNHPDVKAYTDIYVNTQQFLFNTNLFCAWRHVSAAHTTIFRPTYNRKGPFYVRTIWDPTLFTYKVHVK